MFPPKKPKIMNNKSQALELFLSFALLTIQIVNNDTSRIMINVTNEPTPMY